MAVQSFEDVQVFSGVMDGDTEKRFIDTRNGNYSKLLNARVVITDGQNNRAVEDVEGNLLVINDFLNSVNGKNKCVGTVQDVQGQSIIYLVYNDKGYNGIFRYFTNRPGFPDGQIEKIYQIKNPSIYNEYNKSPLDFHPDFLVTGINLVDNLLCFTDYNQQPKQIDIVRANETNKYRKFDFFINKLELSNPITYTVSTLDVNNNEIQADIITSSFLNLFDRVEHLCSQINSIINSKIRAINKANYIEIELKIFGQYNITVNDTGTNQSRVLPNNFYADNLPENFFNRIQAPPFCRPLSNYIPSGGEILPDPPQAYINGGAVLIDSVVRRWCVGIFNKVNDVNNNITIGPTTLIPSANPLPSFNEVKGYISFAGSLTVTVDLTLTINGFLDINAFVKVWLCKITPSGIITEAYVVYNWLQAGFNNPTFPTVINLASPQFNLINSGIGGKWFLFVQDFSTEYVLSNASITIGSKANGVLPSIEKQSCIFRNRYEWENFQKSVYGQATSVVLRTEGYPLQFEIQHKFNDKFISSDEYASRLKKVILSYSKDGGTTWYDYEILDKYNFICEGTQTAIFNNKKLNIPVAPSLASLQFHAVPVKSKSQEYADNRIFNGGIVEGYDTPDVVFDLELIYNDYSLNSFYTSGSLPISLEGFKPGHTGYIGIVYYDDFDRKTGVCVGPNSKIEVPYYPYPMPVDGKINGIIFINGIRIKLYNEPPSWATKYRIVRTKDFSQTSYLMWMVDDLDTVDASGNVTVINPKYYRIKLDNIAFYATKSNRGAVIEYTYEVGDRVKIITNDTGDLLDPIADVRIEYAETNVIYILYDPALNIVKKSIIEIYSKAELESVDNALFFEMGECFEIKSDIFDGILKRYHTGNALTSISPNQSYSFGVVNPAIIETYKGGVYSRMRDLYWDTLTTPQKYLTWINSNYADEYSQSRYDGLTRPNEVIALGAVDLKPAARFSNPYVSGSEINGLNEVEPGNLEKYSSDYGLLCKMQLVNNDIIKLIFANSFQVSIYVKQGVIKQLQGNENFVTVIDAVMGNSHVIQRTLGSQNPESTALNDEGDVIGYDENEGVVWRASGNGILQISDYWQKRNFKNWSVQRKLLNTKQSQCPSVYDIYHDEYILTLGELNGGQEFIPPSSDISLFTIYKDSYIITVFIEETGQVVLPPTNVAAGVSPLVFVKNAFLIFGWTVTINADGSLKLIAPDLTFNNQNIIVQITTSSTLYGPEMVRNGDFIWPVSTYDWEFIVTQWQENLYNNPIFTFGPSFLNHYAPVPGPPPAITPAVQKNIGLTVGNTYRVFYDLEIDVPGSDCFIVLGDGPNETTGTIQTSSGSFLEFLSFNDLLNDKIQFKTTNIYSSLKIKGVSIKPILSNNFTFRFPIKGGKPFVAGEKFEPTTIVFAKKRNGWPQHFGFTPENYGRLNNIIVSFVGGNLWLHTRRAIPKNFYGVQHQRELTFVCNENFKKVKRFKDIAINGIGKNKASIIKIVPYEDFPNGMLSELTYSNFKTNEGIQYAAILKDKLTPGFIDQVKALFNGRDMRGQVLVVTLVNDLPETSLIFNTNILYFYSENS